MSMTVAPYGRKFFTSMPLIGVECWNFTGGEKHTLPTGTILEVERVYDATHTTCMLCDESGDHPGIMLSLKDGTQQRGYRFIVENQQLGKSIGHPMPKKTQDMIGDLLAYESGNADGKQTKRLFRTLRKTGIGSKLQGHYSSRM